MPQSVSTSAPSPSNAAAEPTSAKTDVHDSVIALRWSNTFVSKSFATRVRPATPPRELQYAAKACTASQLARNSARAPLTSATTPIVIESGATPISSDAPAVPGPHGETVGARLGATVGAPAVPRARGAADVPHALTTSVAARNAPTSAPKRSPRPRDAREVIDTDPVPFLSSSRRTTGDPPGTALRAAHSRPQTGQSQARRPLRNAYRDIHCRVPRWHAAWRP